MPPDDLSIQLFKSAANGPRRRFPPSLSEGASSFRLKDFSLGRDEDFWTAFASNRDGPEVLNELPVIGVTIAIKYKLKARDRGAPSDCIIDLNPACSAALSS